MILKIFNAILKRPYFQLNISCDPKKTIFSVQYFMWSYKGHIFSSMFHAILLSPAWEYLVLWQTSFSSWWSVFGALSRGISSTIHFTINHHRDHHYYHAHYHHNHLYLQVSCDQWPHRSLPAEAKVKARTRIWEFQLGRRPRQARGGERGVQALEGEPLWGPTWVRRTSRWCGWWRTSPTSWGSSSRARRTRGTEWLDTQ